MPQRKDKDATRSERKAKRKVLEDRIPDIPVGAEENNPDDDLEVNKSAKKKRSRDTVEKDNDDASRRASKKARTNDDQSKGVKIQKSPQQEERADDAATTEQDGVTSLRRSKKERKAERKALKATAAVDNEKLSGEKGNSAGEEQKVTESTKDRQEVKKKRSAKAPTSNGGVEEKEGKSGKAPRFIVFVGNLPFTATKESIQEHFAKVKPVDVRCLTEKDNPTKSRGIAFMEFEAYDKMKTCLKLMHHSEFDDGKSAPRKINVELTAGGGGKTKQRTAKIAEKNHKLQEERFRRVQAEEKLKAEKRGSDSAGDIHPSRRGRLGLD